MKTFFLDPSISKGTAAVELCGDKVTVYPMLKLMQLHSLITDNHTALFYFENSNLKKGNWHGRNAAGNVGKNKAFCDVIKMMLDHYLCNYIELKPIGYTRKAVDYPITWFFDLTKQQTEILNKKVNEDKRAALIMLASTVKETKHLKINIMTSEKINFIKRPKIGDIVKVYIGHSGVAYGIVTTIGVYGKKNIEKVRLEKITDIPKFEDINFFLDEGRVIWV